MEAMMTKRNKKSKMKLSLLKIKMLKAGKKLESN